MSDCFHGGAQVPTSAPLQAAVAAAGPVASALAVAKAARLELREVQVRMPWQPWVIWWDFFADSWLLRFLLYVFFGDSVQGFGS